jgi:hypothetical protein
MNYERNPTPLHTAFTTAQATTHTMIRMAIMRGLTPKDDQDFVAFIARCATEELRRAREQAR